MKLKVLLLSLVATASILAVACGDDDDGDDATVTPERTPTVEATAPPSTPAASPTAGGGAEVPASVEDAIELVLAGDYEAVEAMFQFQQVACEVDVMGAGGPPQCEADEADGTLVEVLPVSQCEGAFLRAPDIFLAQRMRDQQMTLYGIYEAPAQIFPEGDYAVLFSYVRPETPDMTLTLELMMNDEGVTGVNFGCGEDPATLAQAQGLTDPIAATTTTGGSTSP